MLLQLRVIPDDCYPSEQGGYADRIAYMTNVNESMFSKDEFGSWISWTFRYDVSSGKDGKLPFRDREHFCRDYFESRIASQVHFPGRRLWNPLRISAAERERKICSVSKMMRDEDGDDDGEGGEEVCYRVCTLYNYFGEFFDGMAGRRKKERLLF